MCYSMHCLMVFYLLMTIIYQCYTEKLRYMFILEHKGKGLFLGGVFGLNAESFCMQAGKYETPEWLSVDSIKLLDQLLQVDAKLRITVDKLLNHSWLIKEMGVPVEWQTKYQV